MNAIASLAIASTLSGVFPRERPTPRLSKMIAAMPCEPVDDGGVPIVEDAGEVMQKDDRRTICVANHPIGEVGPINVNGLGRRIVEGRRHLISFPCRRLAACPAFTGRILVFR
jgi:hypothetical protein